MKRRNRLTTLALLGGVAVSVFCLGAVSCSGDQPTGITLPAGTLVLSTLPLTVVPGATAQVTVSLQQTGGPTLQPANLSWVSSDPQRVSVDNTGLIRALAPGTATVTASVGSLSASELVTVVPGGVASPSGSSLLLDGGAELVIPAGAAASTFSIRVDSVPAAMRDARTAGTPLALVGDVNTFAQPVTIVLAYVQGTLPSTVSESDLALYREVSGQWQLVPGSTVNAGNDVVSAQITTLGTFSIRLPQVATSLTVNLPRTSIAEDESQQAAVQLFDQLAQPMTNVTAVAWTSSDPSIASIDPVTGVITAHMPGRVTISATSAGRSGSRDLDITSAEVSRIEVSLAASSIAKGSTTTASAVLRSASNAVLQPAGRTVTFASSNATAASVNAAGLVTGNASGTAYIRATSGSKSDSALITITPTESVPGNVEKITGDAQTKVALTTLDGSIGAIAPSVSVTDGAGRPQANVPVTFAVTSGGGTISGSAVVQTGADGTATLSTWRLGSRPGANTLTASVSGVAPVTFTETATVTLTASFSWPQIIGGGGGITPTADALQVWVRTSVRSVPHLVSATIAGAGKSAVLTLDLPALGAINCTTCFSGALDLAGATPGTQWFVLTAVDTIGTTAKDSIQYNVPASVSTVTVALANPALTVGTTTQATVTLKDAGGTPLPNGDRPVVWSSSNTAVATVNASGVVTAVSAGTATISAAREGKSGGAALTVTAAALVPASATKVTGDGQTLSALSLVASPAVSVRVQDAGGSPVPNVPVTFAVASGGGAITGAAVVQTGSDGIATLATWKLGSRPGANTLTATASGIAPVTFTETATVILSAYLQWPQIYGGGGIKPTPDAMQVSVQAFVSSSPHPATATISVAGKNATLATTSACISCVFGTLDLTGAPAGAQWFILTAVDTIGTTAKDSVLYTVPASVSTVTAALANGTLTAGTTTQATVTLKDAGGTTLPNGDRPPVWSSSHTAVATVNSDGVVTAVAAGTATISATREGKSGGALLTVTAAALVPATVTKMTGDGQTITALGLVRSPAISVRVQDPSGSPVPNVPVTFAVATGGGSVSGSSVVNTGADGIATLSTWKLGSRPGANTLTATVSGLAPVTFTETARVSLTASLSWLQLYGGGGIKPTTDAMQVSVLATVRSDPHPATATISVAGRTATLTATSCMDCVYAPLDLSGIAAGPQWFVMTAVDTIGTTAKDSVQYTVPAAVSAVTVTLASPGLVALTTTQATVTLKDANGTTLPSGNRPVVWSSSDTSVATVSDKGVVKAIANGTATISATREGQTGGAVLTVSP